MIDSCLTSLRGIIPGAKRYYPQESNLIQYHIAIGMLISMVYDLKYEVSFS